VTQPAGKPERAPARPKRTRWQRIAAMDKDILDVEGAATLLGVSASTIYHLAQQGRIPATRIGREWRFALSVSPPRPLCSRAGGASVLSVPSATSLARWRGARQGRRRQRQGGTPGAAGGGKGRLNFLYSL
jgi:excisionase family DNA binding protein